MTVPHHLSISPSAPEALSARLAALDVETWHDIFDAGLLTPSTESPTLPVEQNEAKCGFWDVPHLAEGPFGEVHSFMEEEAPAILRV